jgi:EpsI family protein
MTLPKRILVSAALLGAAFVVVLARSSGEAVPIRAPLDVFPDTVGTWQAREDTLFQPDVLTMLKVKDYLMRRYVDRSGRSLWLYIGYWDTQRKGAQMHSPRNCLPGGGWEPLEASRVTIPVEGRSTPITVNRYVVQKDRDIQVVLYWYQAQGQTIADEITARVAMVRSAIVRNRTDGALVRISAPLRGDVATTTAELGRYARALYPLLAHHLPD